MIYSFRNFTPVVHPTSFVHPQACVMGQVIVGKDCYIGPGAALRGDWGRIILEDGCNVQENCTVHMFPGLTAHLKKGAHIGHGAVIHGATIGRNCLVGINAVIMDHVELAAECIVGALAFIKEGEKYSRRSLVVGSPARLIGKVSEEMMRWKTEGTALYQELPAQMQHELVACEPLRRVPKEWKKQEITYQTWKSRKKGSRTAS